MTSTHLLCSLPSLVRRNSASGLSQGVMNRRCTMAVILAEDEKNHLRIEVTPANREGIGWLILASYLSMATTYALFALR